MYVPAAFAEDRLELLHDLIAKHAFATLVSGVGGEGGGDNRGDGDYRDGDIFVSHVPILLLPDRGRLGTLQFHLARQNDQCQSLAAGARVLAMFHGPHGYISPRWYANALSVPTWNYAVVHARGVARPIDDAALRQHLHALSRAYEPEDGWDPTALPAEVVAKLQQQIVGFEIEILHVEGKWKLGQNRTREDRHAAIAGLRATGNSSDGVLADWMAGASDKWPAAARP